jgi:hypothetical protein
MVPMIFVYAVMILVQGYEEGWTSHVFILASNLLQGLFVINMAIYLYEHLHRTPNEAESNAAQVNSDRKPVFTS